MLGVKEASRFLLALLGGRLGGGQIVIVKPGGRTGGVGRRMLSEHLSEDAAQLESGVTVAADD